MLLFGRGIERGLGDRVAQGPEPLDGDLHRITLLHRTDAARGSGEDDVSRQQGHDVGEVADEIGDGEDEVLCIGGLPELPVDPALDRKSVV